MQTDGVDVVNVTARPEEAVGADRERRLGHRLGAGVAANVIVWLSFLTVKLRLTVGAGL